MKIGQIIWLSDTEGMYAEFKIIDITSKYYILEPVDPDYASWYTDSGSIYFAIERTVADEAYVNGEFDGEEFDDE